MKAKRIVILISLFLIGLSITSPTTAIAQKQTPSILSRLQVVEDPELGELIRAAIEYRRQYYSGVDIEKELEIVRKITESYAQIKLLDRQIDMLDNKVQAGAVPDELQYELILARAELEAKRTTELATLREVVCVMPDYPLSSKPTERLKTWLKLDVLDHRVLVSKGVQPFARSASSTPYIPMRLMSKAEAMKEIGKHFSPEDIPVRIDIYRTADGLALSKELEADVIALIRQAKVEMQAEVHLSDKVQARPQTISFYIERGRISRYRGERQRRVPRVYFENFVEPNEVDQNVRRQLMVPGFLPATCDVIYDPSSRELSIQIAQKIQQVAKSIGLSDYVTIRRTMQELDLQRQYLGRWETTHNGKVLAITIMEEGKCRLLTKNKDTLAGTWETRDKNLYATVEDETILAHIDSAGNLVVESEGLNETSISFQRAD